MDYRCIAYDGAGREIARAVRRAYWGRGVTNWFRAYLSERLLLSDTTRIEINPIIP
jgi:hypothetical protein